MRPDSYRIEFTCDTCAKVCKITHFNGQSEYHCNFAGLFDPEEEDESEYDHTKDDYSHWTIDTKVSATGVCDNYTRDFDEMVRSL